MKATCSLLYRGLCALSAMGAALLPLGADARMLARARSVAGPQRYLAQVAKPAIVIPLSRRLDRVDALGSDEQPWAKQQQQRRHWAFEAEAGGSTDLGVADGAMGLKAPVSISQRQMTALRASLWAGGSAVMGSAEGVLDLGLGASATADGASSASEEGVRAVPSPRGVSRLRDLFSTEYAGPLGVGTRRGEAEVELSVIFDTGSSDLWVASELCSSRACTSEGRHRFNHRRSETFRAAGKGRAGTVHTTYGSGTLAGKLGFDDVRVGPLMARDQELGLISEELGSAFETLPFEGIVGLGFPGLALEPNMSLFDNLAAQCRLERFQFAFYLHRDPSLGGGVLWGGVDRRLYNGTLQWFPVVEQLYWALDLVAFEVGHQIFDFADEAPPRLIVDSGTTFFTAEGSMHRAIAEQVPARRCSQIGDLPALVYTLRDEHNTLHRLAIQPEHYMVHARGGGDDDLCLPAVVSIGMPSAGGRPVMILGEVFMRHFFTVFHRGRVDSEEGASVGFAPARYSQDSEAFFLEMAGRAGEAAEGGASRAV